MPDRVQGDRLGPLRAMLPLAHALRAFVSRRPVRLVLQFIVIAITVAILASNLRGLPEALAGSQVDYRWLAASLAMTVLTVFAGATAWILILRGLGQPITWIDGTRIHVYANLGKYLPGYAWQLVGKAYLTRRLNVPVRLLAEAMTIEFAELAVVGMALALGLFPAGGGLGWVPQPWVLALFHWAGLLLFVAAGAGQLALPTLLQRTRGTAIVRPGPLLAAYLTITAGWLSFGVSFWSIGRSLDNLSLTNVPVFTFALALSFLVSMAVIVVPAGLGVRESAIVLILAPYVSGPVAVLIAALARVVLLVSEFGSAGLLWLTLRLQAKRISGSKAAIPPR
jgi:hypothetical protein